MASDPPSVPSESSAHPDFSMATSDDRTGLMIIRAWVEPGSEQPLRVQIRLTTDVSKDFQRTLTVSDVEAVCPVVERWLMDILAEPTSAE